MRSRVVGAIAGKSLVVFTLFVILSASAPPAGAQATGRAVFRIPFEFTAGGELLPAGEYVIRPADQAGLAYFVQSRDGRSTAAVAVKRTVRDARDDGPARLTFNVYGGEHFLSLARPGAHGIEIEFRKSRAEREGARASANSRGVRVVTSGE